MGAGPDHYGLMAPKQLCQTGLAGGTGNVESGYGNFKLDQEFEVLPESGETSLKDTNIHALKSQIGQSNLISI